MNLAYDLFLLTFNLSQLHNSDKIIQLFIEGLQEIFKPSVFVYMKTSDRIETETFELKTRYKHYGYIKPELISSLENEQIVLLRNSVQMVAVIIDNLEYYNKIENEKTELQKFTESKLIELKGTVKELEDARSASINLIEDLNLEIEKRIDAEKSISKTENYFRFLIEKAPDGIVLIGVDGKMIYASPSARRIFGYSLDLEVMPDPNESTYPDDLPKVLSTLNELFKNPSLVLTIEYRFRKKNGTWNWIESTFSNHFGEEGINAIVINFRDISERKKAERELKESEEKFKNLVWDMQVGVTLQGPDSEIFLCNPMALELLGLSENQLLGKTSFDPSWNVIHEDGSPFPGSTHPVPKAISSRRAVRNEVMGVYRPNKKDRVWIHVDAEPILDSDGNVRQVVCTFVDFTTRKKAEEELILKNLVFEESIAANSISDVNGIITNINSAFIKIWGYNSKEEVIGKPIYEFLESENETAAILNSLSVSGKYSGEYTARRKDNSTFHAYSLATVVYDNFGKIIGYQSSVQDITAKHLAESALRESEEKYRTLIEVSLDAIFINQDNKITYINSSGLKLLGAEKPEQILGKSPFDIFHPDFHKIIRKRIKDMIEKNSTADLIEEKIIRLDGVVVDVEVAATPFVFRNKKALQVILRDITQRKKAEDTLKNSYTLLSTAGRVAKFGGWNVIMSENRSYWSDEVAAIHEMPAGYCPLVSEGINFYAPEFRDKITSVFTECAQNGVPYDEEMQIITSSGKRLWVRTSGEAVRDGKGKIYKVQGFFQDISEQKKSEEEIRKLNEELEEKVNRRTAQLALANKELEAFSYSVSHDLRAPLRAVHSYTRILKEDYKNILDDEGRRICEIIESSSVHMGQLIDELLAFSRIGRSEINTSKIDMNKLVKTVINDITTEEERNFIKIKINKLPSAYGDPAAIKQVITNLLSNAIKYSSKKENPSINIGWEQQKYNQAYFVKDNGVGFDMKYSNKLFGVFQRLHSTKEFEGNGVGLAIVQRIIHRHGGKVWAEGEVGMGATFFFTLPEKDKLVI